MEQPTSAATKGGRLWVWMPLALLICLSLPFIFSDLDLRIQELLFDHERGWRLADQWLITLLYKYGPWPALGMACGGATLLVVSVFWEPWRAHRYLGLFTVLLLLLGPGLLVNYCFKDHFGRPRPREVEEFGGDQSFHRLWHPGNPGEGKSFPSGHASMGFYWMGLAFYFGAGRRRLFHGLLWGGLVYGTLMGFGRIAQGGHFASDILWSAGFIYVTSVALRAIQGACQQPAFPREVL